MTMQDSLPDWRQSTTPTTCLRCDAPTRIETIVPTMFVLSIDDIVYVCPNCGLKSKPAIRGDGVENGRISR